jgi:hypothetical protein
VIDQIAQDVTCYFRLIGITHNQYGHKTRSA